MTSRVQHVALRRWSRPASRDRENLLEKALGLAGLAFAGVAVGVGCLHAPIITAVVVCVVVALAVLARADSFGLAAAAAALLPWFIVTGAILPRLTATFAAGALMLLIAVVAAPALTSSTSSLFLLIGVICFYGPVLSGGLLHGHTDEFIQAAKYVVFPISVFAVTHTTNPGALTRLRTIALFSGVVAVATNLVLGLAGIATGTRASGEVLGYSGEHDLALLASSVAAAGLAGTVTLKRLPATAIGAVATVATGVRSTLPGIALLAIAKMSRAGTRLRTMVLVGIAVAAVFLSGAAGVLEDRFREGAARGEFSSFGALGSGRGDIYRVAVERWADSDPLSWVMGTGLRSVPRFEEEALGAPLVGHSDIVQVGVELGIVGLIGFFLIWAVLIARAPSKAPLLVLASFAVFNGALEYSAPLVVAVLLTARPREEGARVSTAETTPGRPSFSGARGSWRAAGAERRRLGY